MDIESKIWEKYHNEQLSRHNTLIDLGK
jgi:hypothetical protein